MPTDISENKVLKRGQLVPTREKTKLENISFLKLIALALVVLGHSTNPFTGGYTFNTSLHSGLYYQLTYFVYSFHVPLFVFCSGFIFSYSVIELGKYQNTKEFILNKARRLLLPYLAVSFLLAIPVRAVLGIYGAQKLSLILLNAFVIGQTHLWFLLMLFNVFAIFYFLEKYKLTKRTLPLFTFLMVLSFGASFLPDVFDILRLKSSLVYLVFFYFGYLFFKLDILKKTKEQIVPIFLIAFAIHLLLFKTFLFSPPPAVVDHLLTILLAILGIIGSLYFVEFLAKLEPNLFRMPVLKVAEKYSFSVYLFHEPLIFIILFYLRNSFKVPTSLVLVTFCGSILFSLVFAKLLDALFKGKLVGRYI